MRRTSIVQHAFATKRPARSGRACYVLGAALLIGGLLLVAFCGTSLLIGRRLPPPLADGMQAYTNWLGICVGAILLISGAVLAVMADFKGVPATPQTATPGDDGEASHGLAQPRKQARIEQQTNGVNVHRRIPVPRAPVEKI